MPDQGVTYPPADLTANNFRYDATVKQGSTSNLACTVTLTKTPRTVVISLLGAVTNLFLAPTDTVWVNIMSRAPS